MTRHTVRLDPTNADVAYCTECGAEFRAPFDVQALAREECRKDAPASEWTMSTSEVERLRREGLGLIRVSIRGGKVMLESWFEREGL